MGDASLLFSSSTLLCPDTSALLEALRMSKEDADLFLDTLESLKHRVAIPPTVAAEVRDLGLRKVEEAVNTETIAAKHVGHFLDKPQGAGAEHHDEYMASVVALTENFRKRVRAEIERRFERIVGLIDGCIGPELPHDVRLQVLANAPNRYLRHEPPGYTDAGKLPRGDPAAYGDVLAFFEMIHVARIRARDVAFVTNESKEDWWELDPLVAPRRLLRGRRELSHEFRTESGRAFAVFHGLRLVSDLTGLDFLFKQMAGAFRQWEKQSALWTRSQLQPFYDKISEQMQWLHRLPRGLDLASLDTGMRRYERMMQEMQGDILGTGSNFRVSTTLRNAISPSVAQIVNKSNFEIGKLFVPEVVRALGLDRVPSILSALSRGPWDVTKWGLYIPDSFRIMRDMTLTMSSFTAPYLDQMKALIEDARNLPTILPAVMRLDELSRTKLPETRKDASALRRMYSRRRRTLRRSLRGKRINLLNEKLPLKRVLVRPQEE